MMSAALLALSASAQTLNPVINPRGVVNAFSQQPAPSQVAQGGLIWINGISLGPANGAASDGPTLPTQLGDLQVIIGNRPAPLVSADPARIVAQVPYEVPAGLQNVVVRRGESQSRPARINVVAILPVVATKDDKGYGEIATTETGRRLTFQAAGLGATDPRTASGELASPGTLPRTPITVHLGGLPVTAGIQPSTKQAGVFDITVEVPESMQAGDLITLDSGNRLANLATYRTLARPETTFVAMPPDSPEVRALVGSDLRGGFLLASAARTEEGCWPSVLFDLRVKKAAVLKDCLTSANRNAPTPAIANVNGSAIAALVGPPQGDGSPGSGVSSKVAVYQPSAESSRTVDLPFSASQLLSIDSNSFGALAAGTPPQLATIESSSGSVAMGTPAGGQIVAPGGAGGGGGGQPLINPLTLQVDLGDGLNKMLSAPVGVGPGQFAVVVGDDENNPKRAKLAILNQQSEVTAQREFADGWLPMVMPNPPAQPGGGVPGGGLPGGGVPGGGPGGPGGVIIIGPGGAGGPQIAAVRFRVSTYFDAQTRTLYIISRKSDDSAHGLMAFAADVRTIPAPNGTFVAGCTPNVQVLTVDTSRRIALPATNVAEREFKQVCGALSFLVYDLGATEMTNVPLPGSGQVNATNNVFDINDFILAANTAGDTVFVLDGVTLTTYRLDLPQCVVGFANLLTVPAMEMAIATGRSRQNGDAGFLVFDLQNVETRQLLPPDGVNSVQMVGLLATTRKLVAKANRANGSQFLVYDLRNGDVQFIDNPAGVAFVGNVPVQVQPGPGGQPQQQAPAMQRVNTKANTIEAITFGVDRRPNGAMLVRVP